MLAVNTTAHLIASHIRSECLIATALGFVGFTERGGNNKGQLVERFLKGTGLVGAYPWCASFLHHVGYWSQYDVLTKKSSWPLPATAGCLDLHKAAKDKGLLVKVPERGDVFLKYIESEQRLAHTGIILAVKVLPNGTFECLSVEGNTNETGTRDSNTGDGVLIKSRTFNPNNGAKSDVFIRWRSL